MSGRVFTAVVLAFGLGAIGFIVFRVGVGPVIAALLAIGWGFGVLIAWRLALIWLMGASWRVLGTGGVPAGTLRYAWARLLRDSASECLPLSPVGGFVIGGRALVIAGVPAAWATASTVADVTIELGAQLAYVLFGLLTVARRHLAAPLVHSIAVGVVVLGAGAAAFAVLQWIGGALAERVLRRALPDRAAGALGTVATLLAALWRRPGRVLASFALHGLDWLGNGVEAFIALALMGRPIPLGHALAIDSLLYGLRSFAFMVPNAVGVQEAGYVLLGGLFGVAPPTALALSLLRRGRDVAVGAPALLAWQFLEGRRALRRPVDRDADGTDLRSAQAASRASASAGESWTSAS